MKYALTLAFNGSNFSGWQVQKNAPSVQAAVQDAAEKVFGSRLPVTGCSRTDSGVHATGYVCHIESEKRIDAKKLPLAFNSYLPRDISVLSARETGDDFHARYSAFGKEYLYVLRNSPVRYPFSEGLCFLYPHALDTEKLRALSQSYVGRHDFRAFMAAGSKIQDTVRRVYRFDVERKGGFVLMRVAADGFLYNMVRIMVGTLLRAEKGACNIEEALASRERRMAGPTAPACGLYLSRVFYGADGLPERADTGEKTETKIAKKGLI